MGSFIDVMNFSRVGGVEFGYGSFRDGQFSSDGLAVAVEFEMNFTVSCYE